MAFPENLNPATPADTATVASIPGYIRSVKQFLADVFGLTGQTTAPAFSITPNGVVTISQPGAAVQSDPTAALGIASKQYVDARSGGGGFMQVFLGGPLQIVQNVQTILSLNMQAPPSGGPYRLLVSYCLSILAQNGVEADFNVEDSADNAFAPSSIVLPAAGPINGAVNACDISPVTYVANQGTTLILQGGTAPNPSATTAQVSSVTGLWTSVLRAIFVPAS